MLCVWEVLHSTGEVPQLWTFVASPKTCPLSKPQWSFSIRWVSVFALLGTGNLSGLQPLDLGLLPTWTHQAAISLRPPSPIGLHYSWHGPVSPMLPSSQLSEACFSLPSLPTRTLGPIPCSSTGFQKMWGSQRVCKQHLPWSCWETSTWGNGGACNGWPLGKSK